MFKIVESRDEKLTSFSARKYLLCNTAPGQRDIKRSRIAELRQYLDDHLWTKGHLVMASVLGKDPKVLDGQHCLTMVFELPSLNGKSAQVPFHIDVYDCESEAAREVLYAQFNMTTTRSEAEVDKHLGANTDWLGDLPAKCRLLTIRSLPAALSLREGKKGTGPRVTRGAKVLRILDYRPEAEFLHALLWLIQFEKVEDTAFRLKQVATAILLCFWRNPNTASEFFSSVFLGTDLPRQSPQKKLRDFLIAGRNPKISKRAFRDVSLLKCVHAYNAWMTGKPTRLACNPEALVPVPRKNRLGERGNGRSRRSR